MSSQDTFVTPSLPRDGALLALLREGAVTLDHGAAYVARRPIWLYRKLVSPLLPPACRFYPTCSSYADEALATQGFIRGLLLGARRILRCHPWSVGGHDPVPHMKENLS